MESNDLQEYKALVLCILSPLTVIDMNMLLELELVQRFLDQSNKYNLSAECLVTAIQLVRDNPTDELGDVLDQALITWDCIDLECTDDSHD